MSRVGWCDTIHVSGGLARVNVASVFHWCLLSLLKMWISYLGNLYKILHALWLQWSFTIEFCPDQIWTSLSREKPFKIRLMIPSTQCEPACTLTQECIFSKCNIDAQLIYIYNSLFVYCPVLKILQRRNLTHQIQLFCDGSFIVMIIFNFNLNPSIVSVPWIIIRSRYLEGIFKKITIDAFVSNFILILLTNRWNNFMIEKNTKATYHVSLLKEFFS